jgi:Escherichia/Staphylococcus phage prohead protease
VRVGNVKEVAVRKDFKLRLKGSVDEATGSFKGVASVYGNVDLGGDVVDRGAFDKTLQEGRTFPLLWQHMPNMPIGSVQITDSDLGLQVDGKLVLEDPQARIALAHLKARTIKGLSIGYDTIKDSIENGVRHLKELRLWEVSVVTFPMNEAAMVTSVKSIDDARRVLREAAANPDEQGALRSLLKEIRSLLDPEDDEDEGDLTEDEEKEMALALCSMALELKAMRL